MASELGYFDDQLQEEINAFEGIVNELSRLSGAEKPAGVRRAEDKLKRIQQIKRNFNLELRQMPKNEQGAYQQKMRDYESRLARVQQDLKWAKTEGNRRDLMSGAGGAADPSQMNNEQMLAAASSIQDKTEESLAHSLNLVNASKEVGNATAQELGRQRDQIRDITEEVMQIEDNLTRADKLIRTFTRRMATDKVILCFTCLIVCCLGAIIVYASVDKDQDTFSVPDTATPDTDDIVQ